jgi:hypothetical protein
MAGVEKWEMQFYCSFMNKTKTRQLGGGPGVGGLDGGGTPYDNYTGKQAKNKVTKKINGRRLLH